MSNGEFQDVETVVDETDTEETPVKRRPGRKKGQGVKSKFQVLQELKDSGNDYALSQALARYLDANDKARERIMSYATEPALTVLVVGKAVDQSVLDDFRANQAAE